MARNCGRWQRWNDPVAAFSERAPVDPYISGMFTLFNAPLPHRRYYLRRQLRFVLWAVGFIAISLLIGVAGYMGLAHLSFTDAFLNASMILGGMGPVDPLPNGASKWFASFYAIYCGVALLSIVATMLAPTIHRLLHIIHLTQENRAKHAAEAKHPER
jgi:hypothetical protein